MIGPKPARTVTNPSGFSTVGGAAIVSWCRFRDNHHDPVGKRVDAGICCDIAQPRVRQRAPGGDRSDEQLALHFQKTWPARVPRRRVGLVAVVKLPDDLRRGDGFDHRGALQLGAKRPIGATRIAIGAVANEDQQIFDLWDAREDCARRNADDRFSEFQDGNVIGQSATVVVRMNKDGDRLVDLAINLEDSICRPIDFVRHVRSGQNVSRTDQGPRAKTTP